MHAHRFDELCHACFLTVSASELRFFKYHMLAHMIDPILEFGNIDSTATGEKLHGPIKALYRDHSNHRPDQSKPYTYQVIQLLA
jgi:hypothetical protein